MGDAVILEPKLIFADSAQPEAAQTTDSFVNFISRIGVGAGRPDNILSSGHYNFNLITHNRIQLEAAYRGNWIVGNIIDSVADDMTRAGINITTSEGANNVREMLTTMSRLQIFQSITRLVKWADLYGGAIAVIQIEGQDPSEPLDVKSVEMGSFKGLSVYDRWQINPDLDLSKTISVGADQGLPIYYDIILGWENGPSGQQPTGQIKVHHSRCIRMVGIELPFYQAITEQMWGESVLERLWDRLISFDETTMSAASLVDRAQLRTIQIDGFRQIIAAGGKALDGLVQMFEMVRKYQSNEGLTLLDKNDIFQSTSYTFAGLSDVMLQFAQQVSGASKIPLIRLFGQSPAGLNSTGDGDIRMYYDNVNAKQEAKLRNPLFVVLQVLYQSLFGVPAPDDLDFEFVPLWQMSEMDKATISKINSDSIIAAYTAGLIDKQTAMKELRACSGDDGIFSNITDEQINEAENDEPPLPEQAATMPLDLGVSPDSPLDPVAIENKDEKPFRLFGSLFKRKPPEWL